jgi:hypothetical protein
MPRWASRITLEITRVRCERLQDISEEDAIAEGLTIPQSNVICACEGPAPDPGPTHMSHCRWRDPDVDPWDAHGLNALGPHVTEFAIMWNQINGKRGPWSSNPWVWVMEFRRVPPVDDKVPRESWHNQASFRGT